MAPLNHCLDHRWRPVDEIMIGTLYRSIYRYYCANCPALIKWTGEVA